MTPKQDPFSVAFQHLCHLLFALLSGPTTKRLQSRVVVLHFDVPKVLERIVCELVSPLDSDIRGLWSVLVAPLELDVRRLLVREQWYCS